MRFILPLTRRICLATLCGLFAGTAAAVFLFLLVWATETRDAHRVLLLGLPGAGFLIGWVYHRHGRDVAPGNNLILDEIHDPRRIVPWKMAPFILGGTVLTHLVGGSAGREGTAVQMGASLSDQLGRLFRLDQEERRRLLICGMGAGFGAAIGAPWAGAIFGQEVLHAKGIRADGWFDVAIASFAGYLTALALGAPHTAYPVLPTPESTLPLVLSVASAGVAFGLSARFFTTLTHGLEKLLARFVRYSPLRPALAGIALLPFS
ncbi:MAG: hypothetical protein HC902_10940 [Calothrix sp. SM1_5_4]|nr:hypothetical protein [Calothrix sp. SM1_5_4]